MKAREQALRLRQRLAFDRIRQDRSRSRGDGAAGTLEACVQDSVAFELQEEGDSVAAQRVKPLGAMVGCRHRPEIVRVAVVVKDDFLIER